VTLVPVATIRRLEALGLPGSPLMLSSTRIAPFRIGGTVIVFINIV
jgi:hypothetical protein